MNIKNIQLTHLLPEVTRTWYISNGWYTDPVSGTRISKDTMMLYNATYYAHWIIPIVDVNIFVDGVQIDSKTIQTI